MIGLGWPFGRHADMARPLRGKRLPLGQPAEVADVVDEIIAAPLVNYAENHRDNLKGGRVSLRSERFDHERIMLWLRLTGITGISHDDVAFIIEPKLAILS